MASTAGAPASRGPAQATGSTAPLRRRTFLKWLAASAVSLAGAAATRPAVGDTGQPAKGAAPETEAGRNRRLRRWAMAIDLRRCDGCQSVDKPPQCTEACIQGHYVPEPMQWIEVYEAELPGQGTQFVPTPCLQCQNAPCVNVCPVAATFHTPEGIVLIDQERCIGCRICMEACPYDRRFFNWGQPALPPELQFMQYDPEHQSPAIKGTVMKCNLCPQLARAGRLPYCVQACPNSALYYGDMEEDMATNGREVVKLSSFLAENSSYRLKEHLGTEPRVFYIPGHGELVGRHAKQKGRKRTQWPWQKRMQGSETWTR